MHCRVAGPGSWLPALVLLAGCSSTGGGDAFDESDPLAAASKDKAIKVTYFRLTQNPRTRRYEPEYRLMFSEGWKLKHGSWPREPVAQFVRNPYRSGDDGLPGWAMQRVVDELVKHGLLELRATPMEAIDLDAIRKAIGTTNAEVAALWRIITVETDAIRQTVVFRDNFNPAAPALAQKFSRVEREVIKVAVQTTVQVTAERPGFEPPRK